MDLLIAFLIFLVMLVIVTAIVYYILKQLSVPPMFLNIVLAIAGLVLLIWVLQHLGAIQHAF